MVTIEYFKHQHSDGTYSKLPIVPVRVACNKRHQWIWALLDSGADISLFNASIARILGVSPELGTLLPLLGVLEQAEIRSYVHQVNLAVKGLGSVDTIAAFTKDENYPHLAILGRRGFFENFRIEFEFNQRIKIDTRP